VICEGWELLPRCFRSHKLRSHKSRSHKKSPDHIRVSQITHLEVVHGPLHPAPQCGVAEPLYVHHPHQDADDGDDLGLGLGLGVGLGLGRGRGVGLEGEGLGLKKGKGQEREVRGGIKSEEKEQGERMLMSQKTHAQVRARVTKAAHSSTQQRCTFDSRWPNSSSFCLSGVTTSSSCGVCG